MSLVLIVQPCWPQVGGANRSTIYASWATLCNRRTPDSNGKCAKVAAVAPDEFSKFQCP